MEKRILAVDIGTKRVGLAVTDPLNIIATTFKTILFKGNKQLVEDLKLAIQEKNVGTVVVGLPITLSGTESIKTKEVQQIIDFLRLELPPDIIVDTEDEALTTQEAHEILKEMGKNPKKHKDLVDQVAAQCILRSYHNRIRQRKF